jgi:hypothetical protein
MLMSPHVSVGVLLGRKTMQLVLPVGENLYSTPHMHMLWKQAQQEV